VSAASRPKRSRAPVDVFRYRDYREFLAAFYAQGKHNGLSYRGFARVAGLGAPNYLKLVIDGKRNLSAEMAERFARACRLNEESTQYFSLLVAFNQATGDEERNALHESLSRFARFRASQRLDLAEKEYHSTWFIPAIRELVTCPGFQEDAAWIAEQLEPAISEKEAGHALDVLLRLGLLERDERGSLVQATRAVTTGAQANGLYNRNYHAELMQRAVHAMHHLPAEERYISGLTLSASPATLAEVRRRVIAFRQELVALCDADPGPSRVVQLNLQLFPLSRSIGARSGAPLADSTSEPVKARRTVASTSKKDQVP
jgi:uncharacterized protein (TIGR02147 family)